MSTLYITEYADSGARQGLGNAAMEPAITTQTVTVSGVTAQSAAFNGATRLVRLHTDGIMSVLFGSNPTATTGKARLIAGQTEYFAVKAGDKVAAITNT